MADFLEIQDEIIDGEPKYNITDNDDGTKSISLANVVTQEGTALNKASLQQINNVLGYNTPAITQEVVSTAYERASTAAYIGSGLSVVSPTWSGNNVSIGSSIKCTCGNMNCTITGSGSFHSSSRSSYYLFNIVTYSSSRNSSSYLPTATSTSSTSSAGYYFHVISSNIAGYLNITFNFNEEVSPTLTISTSSLSSTASTFYLYYINDSGNETLAATGTSGVSNNFTSTTFKEANAFSKVWTLKFPVEYNSTYGYYTSTLINTISVNAYKKVEVPYYKNNCVVNDNISFKNNQKVLIEMPSTTPTTNVTANAINGITCDTLLQPSTKYEVVYSATQNKFITRRVQIAQGSFSSSSSFTTISLDFTPDVVLTSGAPNHYIPSLVIHGNSTSENTASWSAGNYYANGYILNKGFAVKTENSGILYYTAIKF